MRWAWLVVALAACEPKYPHVTLKPPARDLSATERVDAFNALMPKDVVVTVVTQKCNTGPCGEWVNEGVRLANGTEVHYPEDLRPLVAPNSDTAHAIDDRQTEHTRTLFYGIVGTAALLGGGLWLVSTDGPVLSTSEPTRLIGGGALVLAGILGIALSYKHYDAYVADTHHAYAAYPHDLAATLNVCVDGLAVVPCETGHQPAGYYDSAPQPVPSE